jgi:hypothetical protein
MCILKEIHKEIIVETKMCILKEIHKERKSNTRNKKNTKFTSVEMISDLK